MCYSIIPDLIRPVLMTSRPRIVSSALINSIMNLLEKLFIVHFTPDEIEWSCDNSGLANPGKEGGGGFTHLERIYGENSNSPPA